MRGLLFFLAFVSALPLIFVSPFNGVLLWYVFSLGNYHTLIWGAPFATGGIDVALYVLDDDNIVLCVGARFDGVEQMDRDSKDIVHVSRRVCVDDDARASEPARLGGCPRSWRMGSERRDHVASPRGRYDPRPGYGEER